MIFETDRLILRHWTTDDAESLYKYAKDPLVGPIAGWPVHTSVDNSKEIIQTVLSADETYAVCLKENNIAIGSVGLIPPAQTLTKSGDDEIEIGYWIGVPFWGKGLIPEAVKKMQEHAFNDLGINVMWCGYYDGNEKSRKCQEKCGFTFHHTEENKPCELMGDVRTEHFTRITKEQWQAINSKKDIVVYVHGKGGSAKEAENYKPFFKEDVYGFDYRSENPCDAKAEFSEKFKELSDKYNKITLIANSIGAYFSMNSGIEKYVSKAYFISPIVNLERLILDMLEWAGATEQELEEKKIIPIDFGDDLSWDYLQYVRKHKISWTVPTDILYGTNDNMQSLDTIKEFCSKASTTLTVMNGGEHWFHTKEQMEFLDEWIKNISKADSHMIKIMFVCHGNICRSPMAEFVLKDMIKRRGLENDFVISSSATSTEEIWNGVGNPVYPPARVVLENHGINPSGKRAIQLKASDYDKYDLFIGMDSANILNMTRILGGDKDNKIHKLMEYTGSSADVSDPWYTRDFDRCYKDIYAGCEALLNSLI